MNILVTGSDGFIGKELCTYLGNNHTLVQVDQKSTGRVQELDSNDIDSIDFIIHLAGASGVRESFNDPEHYMDNNVYATNHLSKLAYKYNVPFLYASSSTSNVWHKHPYGSSKRMCELVCENRGQVGMRFTTVYGPTSRDNMLLGRLVNGKLEYVTTHIRDFIHVSDVCSAIELLIKNYQVLPPVVDIGTGFGVRVDKLLPGFPVTEGKSFEATENICNPEYIRGLGWNPKHNIYDFVRNYL